LVGSDALTLRSLGDCLAVLGPRLRVLTAAGGEAAAALLSAERVDVLVTQLVMPQMDGFELAAFGLRHHPGLEVVLMEGREWGRVQQALTAEGAFRFLAQPVEPQQLIDAVLGEADGDASGQFSGLSLSGMLQLLAAEARSCAVRVAGARGEGRVELQNGAIVNAVAGEMRGRDALYELLSWEDADFALQSLQPPVYRRIDEPLAQLLLEAAQRQDEGARDRRTLPAGAAPARSPAVVAGPAASLYFTPGEFQPMLAPLAALAGFELAALLDAGPERCLAAASLGDPEVAARSALAAAREALRAIPEEQRGWLRQVKANPAHPLQILRFLRGDPQTILFVSADADPAAVHAALDAAEERSPRADPRR
jgi:CheY-like chemotaxis protein